MDAVARREYPPSMDAVLEKASIACAIVAGIAWLSAVVTRECSWVDRVWSILPPAYVVCFAYASGWDARLDLMAVCAVAWGARLTFNFARKGGYAKGGEDYRWAVLRTRMSPALFQVFNLVFIAAFQNALLLAITLPAWAATHHAGVALGPLDLVAAAAFLGFLALETVTDEVQWRFQSEKKARRARGEAVTEEFATGGPFRFSRHPNFFAEQGMWWSFAIFAVAFHHGSTTFTEEITRSRYPAYATYQRTTSRLIPWPPARSG